MSIGEGLYQGSFRTQYDGGPRANANCTPTSLAMAADAATGGGITPTGSQVRALLQPREETNPVSPGWSLTDADLAARRLGFGFTHLVGPWSELVARRAEGRFIVLQGDSDVFPDGCSGAFDGDHAVGLPPLNHSDGRWRLGDPICAAWRWEKWSILRDYAAKFAGPGLARYGYTDPVPPLLPDTAGDDMPGIRLTDIALEPGVVTVKDIPGVQAVNVADPTKRDVMQPGWKKPTIGKARVLGDPFGADTDISRHIVRLLGGTDENGAQVELAVILAAQTDFAATPVVPPNCDSAVSQALDHLTAPLSALVTAVEEARP